MSCVTFFDVFRGYFPRSRVTNVQGATDPVATISPRSRTVQALVTLGWLAALGLLSAVVFAGSLYLSVRAVFLGGEIDVPDVTSRGIEDAREILGRSDLHLEVTSERFDASIASGAVRAQDPPAGAKIKPGRKVRVSVSLGPIKVQIPDVTGQTLRTAQIALQREGLPIGHVTYTHERDVPEDTIIGQDPLPSAPLSPGSAGVPTARPDWDGRVNLLVSRGPEEPQFIMPDLADRPIGQVRAFAERAGLRIGAVRTERVAGMLRGRVIRQYPRAGYPIGEHDIISLVLSE